MHGMSYCKDLNDIARIAGSECVLLPCKLRSHSVPSARSTLLAGASPTTLGYRGYTGLPNKNLASRLHFLAAFRRNAVAVASWYQWLSSIRVPDHMVYTTTTGDYSDFERRVLSQIGGWGNPEVPEQVASIRDFPVRYGFTTYGGDRL